MASRKLKLEITVDDKGSVHVKQFGDKTTRQLGRVGRSVDTLDRKNKASIGTWKKLAVAAAGFFAVTKITASMKEWVSLAGQQQKAMAGMEQAMRSMGRYTPELYNQLINTAKALQEVTTFGDEATIEGQKFLLTYKNIADDVLPRASAVMLDLAALMGGDTRQAANMLGKASMGLAGELRRVGITIDANIAKSGDFVAMLGEIEKQVGGQARALASTGYGGLEQLSNLWGDTKEDLGELVLVVTESLLPALKSWAIALSDIAKYWKEVLKGPDVDELILKHLRAQKKYYEFQLGKAKTAAASKSAFGDEFLDRITFGLYRTKAEGERDVLIYQDIIANLPQTIAGLTIPDSARETGRFSKEFLEEGKRLKRPQGLKPWLTGAGGTAASMGWSFPVKFDVGEALKAGAEARAELRLLGIEQIQGEIDRLREEILRASDDYTAGWKRGMDEWLEYSRSGFEQMQDLAYDTALAMQDAFGEFFFDAFTGKLKSLEDYINSFLRSIARSISSILSENLTKGIIGLIMGIGRGSSGWTAPGAFPRYGAPGFAAGGPVTAGGLYMVGERGPELFMPRQAGMIVPNNRLGTAAPKITIQIINTGQQAEVSHQQTIQIRPDEWVIKVWMDAAERNRFGLRDMIGRS